MANLATRRTRPDRQRRRLGTIALLWVMTSVATSVSLLLIGPTTAAHADPAPRPLPGPLDVSITDAGLVPADVSVVEGQSVVFHNDTATDQAVTDTAGAFGSGTIPAGGAFVVAVGAAGFHSIVTATTPAATGSITVGRLELDGPASSPVLGDLPDLPVPPVTDFDELPDRGISVSRSRITVLFAPGATLGDANAAFAAADVKVLSTVPEIGVVLVGVDAPPVGDFAPVLAAAASLRADPAVAAAALDFEEAPATVPGKAEDIPPLQDPTAWTWQDIRNTDGSAVGTGGNWGMEISRFPQAWNWLDGIRQADHTIDTLVFDLGFTSNDDLPIDIRPICPGGTCTTDGVPSHDNDHATHVAGIIGAAWNNPLAPDEPLPVRGVDGGNPVVKLYGAAVGNNNPTVTGEQRFGSFGVVASYTAALDGKLDGTWPNLRVMNMSLSSIVLTTDPDGRAKWGRLIGARRCGPGDSDDGPGATGPCTLSTDDLVRREIAQKGIVAKTLGELASQRNVIIPVAAGNQSGLVCSATSGAVAQPLVSGSCPAGMTFVREDARLMDDWGWAATALGPTDANPFILVEAIDINKHPAKRSDTGGTVAAPGVDILSTRFDHTYGLDSGTSMATPHVSAFVGYLLAADPTVSVSEIRHLLDDDGRPDVSGGLGTPRLDAFDATLGLDGMAQRLVDVNDSTPDGNRRVERTRSGDERPDTVFGPIVEGAQLHSTPDGRIDMRDFRRYRDAILESCADAGAAATWTNCPTPDQIELDGAPAHPKKDLNFDGCVHDPAGDESCANNESSFSRFDFNGDGSVALDHAAQLPLIRTGDHGTMPSGSLATGQAFTDLDLFEQWFDTDPSKTEGWRASQLRDLLISGDLEVHADALFESGADHVDVTVQYGNQFAPVQRIAKQGGQAIMTVPVAAAGQEVQVFGTGYNDDGTIQSHSLSENPTLEPGSDRRVDLCAATVVAVPSYTSIFADGQSTSNVQLSVQTCGRSAGAGIQIDTQLSHPTDSNPTAATLSTPNTVTDLYGHSSVVIQAGNVGEALQLKATASVDLDPTTPGPETVTNTVAIQVTDPPRLIYKWEQTTDDWQIHEHSIGGANGDTTYESDYTPRGAAPLVLSRSGSLQPTGDDVRLVEHVGANEVDYTVHTTGDDGSSDTADSQMLIPTTERSTDFDALMSSLPTNLFDEHGLSRPPDQWTYAQTSMDVSDDAVTVDHFRDVGDSSYYLYGNSDHPCAFPYSCLSFPERDQLTLNGRLDGSPLAFAGDLDRSLTFHRNDDGTFDTYHWCSQPKTYTMRGNDALPDFYKATGTAHSRFRFIATVTTDPNMTGEDLVLPESCDAPVAPVAAFTKDADQPTEGRTVHFRDTSTDSNGDIDDWAWDFGEGTTSTDQNPEHRFEDDGTYRVTLTVTDSTGLSNSTQVDITVVNGAPEVSASDVTVDSGQPVTVDLRLFDPSERDQEYLKLSVTWDDGQGPIYSNTLTAGGALSLNLGTLPDGVRPLRITVTDKDLAAASIVITVKVGAGATGTPEPPPEMEAPPAPSCGFGVRNDQRELELADLVNGYRDTNGDDPVYPSPTLTAAATAQARWLRDNDLFQHAGDGGSTPLSRAVAAGYPAGTVSEILARGPSEAAGALVAWKMSTAHDAALLDGSWNGVGIAAVDTTQGTLWVVVFGTRLDCPTGPPDFDPATNPIDPYVAPDGTPTTMVLASRQSPHDAATATDATPEPAPASEVSGHPIDLAPLPESAPPSGPAVAAPATAGASPATAGASPPPVAAFTASSLASGTGDPITVTNRSGTDLQVEPGDGRPAPTLPADAALDVAYLDPGNITLTGHVGGLSASVAVTVSGTPRPPVITYTGPTSAAFASLADLTATLTTGAGVAVPGRTVTFTIGGRQFDATTDTSGLASVQLVADLPPGPYTLDVVAPPLATGPGSSTSSPFTIGANAPPVIDTHGPYEVELGQDLHLDTSGSYDPDSPALAALRWDLDDDGTFDDATGDEVVPATTVASVVCGGTCDPSQAYPIALEGIDSAGGVTIAHTDVHPIRDFRISLTPASSTLNPNGNTSFQVMVSTASGFTDPVQLSAANLPAGVTASFYPASVTPGHTSLLSLHADATVQAFAGGFLVRGTSGSVVRENPGTIDVEFGLVPACAGSADIHVTDSATGAPIAGALVFGTWPTDADGYVHYDQYFSLGPNNSPVQRTFYAAAPGYDYLSVDAYVGCGPATAVELPLVPSKYVSIQGRLVVGIPDPNDHTSSRRITPTDIPVPGYVNLSPGGSANADADGQVAFGPLQLPVHSQMQAGADGYWTEQSGVNLLDPATVTFVQPLVPQCTGEVDVRVRDAHTHLPIEGAAVAVYGAPSPPRTDAAGRSRSTDVPLGFHNSKVDLSVRATATLGGTPITALGAITLTDCGTIAQLDLDVATPVPNYGDLSGTVTNAVTHEVMPNLTVSLSYNGVPYVTTTDAAGHYGFTHIFIGNDDTTTGSAIVSATPPDTDNWLHPSSQSVPLSSAAPVVQDLVVTPRMFSDLDVHVVDAANGEPVAGMSVNVIGANIPVAATGADGYVHFRHIPTNNVTMSLGVQVTSDGFLFASTSTSLAPGTLGSVEIEVNRTCAPASAQGIVRDASTQLPLEGAVVESSNPYRMTTTGPDGRFLLTDLTVYERKPTSVLLTARKPGYLSASRLITTYCGAQLTVNLGSAITGTASLGGTVTDGRDGTPAAGVVVGGSWGATATTGADGRYTFASVPIEDGAASEDWTVSFVPSYTSGLDGTTRTVTVHPDEAATLDVTLGVPPPDQRPVAHVLDVTIPTGQSTLVVTMDATDPDGDPLSYRIADRSADVGSSQTYPSPQVTVWLNGTTNEGTITYVASDGRLDSAPATITIHRGGTAANQPPVAAIAALAPTPEGSPVALDATGSHDPDGTITSYEWDLDGDGQYDDATGATTSVTFPDNGPVMVGVRVTDDDGATATMSRTVTITNVAPVVDAGPPATLGADGHLHRSGSFADPGTDAWTATVDWGEGGGASPLPLTGTTFALDHTYAVPATYDVLVEVCDDDDGCGSGSFAVTVPEPANVAPTAVIAPPGSVPEGTTAGLDGSGSSDPDGMIASYEWDLDGDGQYDDATGATPALPTTDDAVLAIGVRVTDDSGATATTSTVLTVANVSPAVDAGPDGTIEAGTAFTGTGSFTDPGADTWTAMADWGDGSPTEALGLTGKGFALDHTYGGAGAYTVTVEVCDDDGGCGSDTVDVDVSDPTSTSSTSTSTSTTSTSTSTSTPTSSTSTTSSTTSSTSTSSSTSTTTTSSTTTTADPSRTTTSADSTTTGPASTTWSLPGAGSGDPGATVAGANATASAAGVTTGDGTLPVTGGSPWPLALLGLLTAATGIALLRLRRRLGR